MPCPRGPAFLERDKFKKKQTQLYIEDFVLKCSVFFFFFNLESHLCQWRLARLYVENTIESHGWPKAFISLLGRREHAPVVSNTTEAVPCVQHVRARTLLVLCSQSGQSVVVVVSFSSLCKDSGTMFDHSLPALFFFLFFFFYLFFFSKWRLARAH